MSDYAPGVSVHHFTAAELAEHDRQEREKAWDEGYFDDYSQRDSGKDRNPYRKQEPNVVRPEEK
jgi:hypothetical protein